MPSKTPKVSVIIPAYNRVTSIKSAIESVLRQTYENFELIIVDDGSTDGTMDVVAEIKDPRIRTLKTPHNMGASSARNVGIENARAEWIAFQDSDDEWLPEKLAMQMARIDEPGTRWVAVYCGMVIIGAPALVDDPLRAKTRRTKVHYIPRREIDIVEGDIRRSLLRTSLISTQMLVVRRDVLEKSGLFDPNLPSLVDWDLVMRIADVGPVAFVDEPLVLQRFSQNSLTRDLTRRIEARSAILKKHAERFEQSPTDKAQQYRVLAGECRRVKQYEKALEAMKVAQKAQPHSLTLLGHYFYLWSRTKLNRILGVHPPQAF